MTAGWRTRWLVTVANNAGRDGRAWRFASLSNVNVWSVLRNDGGKFPVFSAVREGDALPAADHLEAMTREAVADLLTTAGLPDSSVGWITDNITTALRLASVEVRAWHGAECGLETDTDGATVWASPSDGRTPYWWLVGEGIDCEPYVGIYQDQGVFGLSFTEERRPGLPKADGGWLRPRHNIPMATGRINKVELVYDTSVDECSAPGLVTEVLLHSDTSSTLLIAAEAYSRDEWKLYDESVVVVASVATADALAWDLPRWQWRPTQ